MAGWDYRAFLWRACVGALFTPVAVHGQGGPLFHFSAPPGPYAVGLQVVEQYDRARTFGSSLDELGKRHRTELGRPLQTLVWYPANRGGLSKTMTMGDYLSLMQTEIHFEHPQVSVKAKEWSSTLGPALAMPLRAIRDAPPEPRRLRFPIVIYAPGANNPAWENADLCEYLASHGYVVIASPSLGAKSRSMPADIGDANAQAADISFLIGYAQTRSDTQMAHIAVAGMSWGGLANLLAAARDSRIAALVSLDGSMRYYAHVLEEAGDVHPEQMAIPLLAFEQRNFSIEDADHYLPPEDRGGPNVLNRWTHGDLITIHMMGLSHAAFTSLYQRSENFWWELDHVYTLAQADYGRAEAMTGYAWVACYTLQFLNAYFRDDAAAKAFLKSSPAENHVPPHVMAVSFRPGAGSPVSFEWFRAELGHRGFNHAAEAYADFRGRDPNFNVEEGLMTDWADELLAGNHLSEALDVLTLNLRIHPDSSKAYLQLGKTHELLGQRTLAAEDYKGALARDSLNADAKRRLTQLWNRDVSLSH